MKKILVLGENSRSSLGLQKTAVQYSTHLKSMLRLLPAPMKYTHCDQCMGDQKPQSRHIRKVARYVSSKAKVPWY